MITVVGSLNYDFIVPVPRFPMAGETLHGKDAIGACGGKGANQAYAAARLGARVAMVGCVGADLLGDAMLRNLSDAGVDIKPVRRIAHAASGMALILVDAHAENQIVISPGANHKVEGGDVYAIAEMLKHSKLLLAQFEVPAEVTWLALEMAHNAGVATVLTPAPYVAFDTALLKHVDYLALNEIEASQLSGLQVVDVASAQRAAHMIIGMGARNVLLTLGERGVWVEAVGYHGHIPAFRVNAIDTVGAGDCFVGAVAARLHAGDAIQVAARYGCAAAACSVTRRGAQPSFPNAQDVQRLLGD